MCLQHTEILNVGKKPVIFFLLLCLWFGHHRYNPVDFPCPAFLFQKYIWMAEGSQLYLTEIISQDAVFLQGKKQLPKEDLYFRYLIEDD